MYDCGHLHSRVFSNFWLDSDRKQLVEFKLEHALLTGTRGGLCGWIQLKVWQYNVTSALYMLDWWEGLLFNIFMGSVFTGIVLSLGWRKHADHLVLRAVSSETQCKKPMQPHTGIAACPFCLDLKLGCTQRHVGYFLTVAMLLCRHRGGHVRLLSQLYHPRHLEYMSCRYVGIVTVQCFFAPGTR